MKSLNRFCLPLALVAIGVAALACSGKKNRPPATTQGQTGAVARTTPTPRTEAPISQPTLEDRDDELLGDFSDPDNIFGRSLEDINADSPLDDVRFDFDSAVLLAEARATLDRHAEWLRRYPTVTILIEGHCDERGTVEYNLALGERRAAAALDYLASLGTPVSRLKTISYGKEFPLDPGHDEAAWARNRRAHFQITAK